MKKMKRIVLTVTILALFFTGCATENNNEIVVVSRKKVRAPEEHLLNFLELKKRMQMGIR